MKLTCKFVTVSKETRGTPCPFFCCLSSASSPSGAGDFCGQVCPAGRIPDSRWPDRKSSLCAFAHEALEKGHSLIEIHCLFKHHRMLGRSQEVEKPGSVRSAWQEFGTAHCKHICLFRCHAWKWLSWIYFRQAFIVQNKRTSYGPFVPL